MGRPTDVVRRVTESCNIDTLEAALAWVAEKAPNLGAPDDVSVKVDITPIYVFTGDDLFGSNAARTGSSQRVGHYEVAVSYDTPVATPPPPGRAPVVPLR